MKRQESREMAMILLFESTFRDSDAEEILKDAAEFQENISNFSKELFLGAFKHIARIDEIIEKYSKSWKKERLSRVVISILRLSVFEIIYNDTPCEISINEAVLLTKKYSTPEEAQFVNGILGSVSKDLESLKANKDEE